MTDHDPRPEPLSSADCNLRGLEWMPLDVITLPDSDLALKSSGDAFKAAVILWCKSWRQVPAGSLPNDDESLFTLAQVKSLRVWRGMRDMALRGWVECADGRLYHPVVASKAMEALPHRQHFLEKKSAETDRKTREREERKRMFSALKAAGITLPWDTKTAELRDRINKLPPSENADISAPPPPADQEPTGAPPVTPPVTPVTPPVTPPVTARTGPDLTPPDALSPTENPSEGVPAAPPPGPEQPDLIDPPEPTPVKPARTRQRPRPDPGEAPTTTVWRAYAAAFRDRYRVEPERNQQTNGQLANLLGKVAKDDVPDVIAFYVREKTNRLYVEQMHPIGLFVRDYHGIRTHWLQTRQGIAAPVQEAPMTPRAQSLASVVGGGRPLTTRPKDATDVEARDVRTLTR